MRKIIHLTEYECCLASETIASYLFNISLHLKTFSTKEPPDIKIEVKSEPEPTEHDAYNEPNDEALDLSMPKGMCTTIAISFHFI